MASEDMDCRSDLYSLGATFYHLISGKQVFDGSTPAEILMHHVKMVPTPLSELCPDLPAPMVELIHRLIAKVPDERPNGPAALLGELKAMADGIGLDLDNFDFARHASAFEPVPVIADDPETRPGERNLTVEPTVVLPKSGGIVALRRPEDTPRPWPGAKALLKISDARTGGSWDVALLAAFPVRFGRAVGESVEMSIRLYPVDKFKAESMSLSSVHGEFDDHEPDAAT